MFRRPVKMAIRLTVREGFASPTYANTAVSWLKAWAAFSIPRVFGYGASPRRLALLSS
jgi:hypothetical protein